MKALDWAVLGACLAAMVVLLVPSAAVNADDEHRAPIALTADGTIVSLLDEFTPDAKDGAAGPCAAVNVFKVRTAITGESIPVEALAGELLHFLPTEKAEPLRVGETYRGLEIMMDVVYYPASSVIKIVDVVLPELGFQFEPVGEQSNTPKY